MGCRQTQPDQVQLKVSPRPAPNSKSIDGEEYTARYDAIDQVVENSNPTFNHNKQRNYESISDWSVGDVDFGKDIDKKIIFPIAGFVLKTNRTTDSSKTFVNICYSEDVIGAVALTRPKEHTDKAGNLCLVYDAVIPLEEYAKCFKNSQRAVEDINTVYPNFSQT